ncbi:unnamed protein product [Musa banksii]
MYIYIGNSDSMENDGLEAVKPVQFHSKPWPPPLLLLLLLLQVVCLLCEAGLVDLDLGLLFLILLPSPDEERRDPLRSRSGHGVLVARKVTEGEEVLRVPRADGEPGGFGFIGEDAAAKVFASSVPSPRVGLGSLIGYGEG